MRILVVNYEMNEQSGVLAWQACVASELARSCRQVVVLTRRMGQLSTLPNMHIEVMPRRSPGVLHRLLDSLLLNWRTFRLCRLYHVDVCFIHMAHEWAYRVFPALFLSGVPILLWYAHGGVTPGLRMAHRCATRVVTSTPEGFRIPSDKVRAIGQGVNTNLFTIQDSGEPRDILYVGRVSRRKRIELLLSVMDVVRRRAPDNPLRLKIVGPMLTPDDLEYDAELRAQMWRLGLQDRLEFVGFVPQEYIPSYYRSAFLHLNLSQTGSMDKTVVEALACGCPVLTSNEALFQMLRDYPEFTVPDDCPEAIARQILELYQRQGQYDRQALRSLVMGQHDLGTYVQQVMMNLREIGHE